MNYLFDKNDALRISPPGRSILFHLDKLLHLVALRQIPSFFALLLVTMSYAGQKSNVIGSTGFQAVLICGTYGLS